MKSVLYFVIMVFFLFFSVSEKSIAQSWLWAKSIGGIDYDYAQSVVFDPTSGAVYTTGSFEGTVDFDPGAGTYNLTGGGMFVSKLNSTGNFVWAKAMGPVCSGYSIVVDPGSGAIYTTGSFSGTVDFDPGTGIYNLTGGGIFISKLDGSGNFLWAKAMGINSDFGYSIAIDTTGSGAVYTTGYFTGTSDFDPGAGTYSLTSSIEYYYYACDFFDCIYYPDCENLCPYPFYASATFISKLDESGNFLWAKAMEGTGSNYSYSYGYSIAIDPSGSGDIYTTGYFYGTVDFDPDSLGIFNLTTTGTYDIFISKLDSSGDFVWAKVLGGGYGFGYSMTLDTSGNVYTTGLFQYTVDFDPGAGIFNLTSAGGNDIFISKLDSSGDFAWAKAIGGTGWGDVGYAIALDPVGNGDVYTIGTFSGTVDFDPGPETFDLTGGGIFISRLDSSGNFVHAIEVGGTGNELCKSLALDDSGYVYVAGYFYSPFITIGPITLTNANDGTIYFDEEGNPIFTSDLFMAKLDPCASIVTNTANNGPGSLRDIISCSLSGDTITFDNALMDQTIVLTSGEIVIYKNLILSGLGMTHITLSGKTSRIFHLLQGKNLIIEDLAMKNGTSVSNGGAIFVEGNLTLENVLMQSNLENGLPKAMTVTGTAVVNVKGSVEIKY